MGRGWHTFRLDEKEMTNDNDNDVMDVIESQIEAGSLLGGRYYVILQDTGAGAFTVKGYDTTGKEYENEEDFSPAYVMLHAVMTQLRENTDEMYDKGVAEIEYGLAAESMAENAEEGDDKEFLEAMVNSTTSNIIKVDFGRKQ